MFKTVQQKNPGWSNVQRDNLPVQTSLRLESYRWRFEGGNVATINATGDYTADHRDSTQDVVDHPTHNLDEPEAHNAAFQEETPTNNPLDMAFPAVEKLSLVLPLTSTPTSTDVPPASGLPRPRLSDVRPRGLLPMEFEDSPLGSSSRSSRFKQALARRTKQAKKALSMTQDSSSETD